MTGGERGERETSTGSGTGHHASGTVSETRRAWRAVVPATASPVRRGRWHRFRLTAGSLVPSSSKPRIGSLARTLLPRTGRRRLLGASLVIALLAGATWALWWGRGDALGEREIFESALANLAAAPAVRYTTSIGDEVVVPYEVTATGEAQAHTPDIAALPGDISTDLLFVDDKLFIRMTGSLDPEDLGLDTSNPAVAEALENVENREGGLGSGEWVTSVSEYDGPILRDSMSPVGRASTLIALLVETPDDQLRRSPEPIDGTPALVAETSGGDIYVSSTSPHRVLRFVPAPPPGTEDDPPATPPTAPSIPEMPSVPERPDGPGSERGPEIPEMPSLQQADGASGRARAPQQEEPQPVPGDERSTPADPTGVAAPMLEQVGQGGAHVDLEILHGDEVQEVYDEIAASTAELVDAEDGVLQYADDEMAESLAQALAAGEALGSCGAESCEVEADATLVHGRGNEVPTAATFAMTVDGEPAGQCTARGVIPVSGTGPLGCTNDSEEWVAAYRSGGEIGVEVTEIEAMAFSPDDVETVTADIEAHAAVATRAERSDLQVSGFLGRQVDGEEAQDPRASATTDAVLEELDVPESAWEELVERAGRQPPGRGASETITVADVALLEQTILQAVYAWHGGRLLDRIDPASAGRVMERALAARTRTELRRAIAVLNAAYHVIWTSDLAPGRTDSLARDANVFLDVAEDSLTDGEHDVDLSELGLDATTGRVLDVAYVTQDGSWHFETVVPDVSQARTAAFARDVALLRDAVALGLGGGVVDIRQADGLDGLFTDGVPAAPFGGAFQPTQPPSPDNQPEGPRVTVSPSVDEAAQRSRDRGTPLGGEQEEAIRSTHRVNESAEVIAAAGYRVIRDQGSAIDDDLAIDDEANIVEHKAPQGNTSMDNTARRLDGSQSNHYVVNLNDMNDPQQAVTDLQEAVSRRPRSRVDSITAVVGSDLVPVSPMQGSPVDVIGGRAPTAGRPGSGAPATASRPPLGLRLPGLEFDHQQVRAMGDTVNDLRNAERQLPREARQGLRTPATMRRVLEDGMNRRRVPFQPRACTCPPCGATPSPGL